MAAGIDRGRKRRAAQVGQIFFEAFVFLVEGTAFPANAASLAAITRCIPANGHARAASFAGAKKSDFGSEGIFVGIILSLQIFDSAWNAGAGNFSKGTAGDAAIISIGMGRIPLRRHANAPTFVGIDGFRLVVEVFA